MRVYPRIGIKRSELAKHTAWTQTVRVRTSVPSLRGARLVGHYQHPVPHASPASVLTSLSLGLYATTEALTM